MDEDDWNAIGVAMLTVAIAPIVALVLHEEGMKKLYQQSRLGMTGAYLFVAAGFCLWVGVLIVVSVHGPSAAAWAVGLLKGVWPYVTAPPRHAVSLADSVEPWQYALAAFGLSAIFAGLGLLHMQRGGVSE